MLSDDQVAVLVSNEITTATGAEAGEISQERRAALDANLGMPDGKEREGRSTYVSRDTTETIEALVPVLMKLFSEQDALVVFEPTSPEDRKQAEIETRAVNDVFWKSGNGGFSILQT